MIDNLTSTSVYVEKKMLIEITCNNTVNNNGIIEVDNISNKLVSKIDSGDTILYRLKEYKGENSLLLYNENDFNIRIVDSGEMINMPLDFAKGTKYLLGAKKIYASRSSEKNKFDCDLGEYSIFKIFLDNGKNLKNFSYDENSITILGSDTNYIDEFSELTIYAYKTNTINDDSYSFTIEYYGYESIWDLEAFISQEYFETFRGEEIICAESFEISQSVVKDSEKNDFRVSKKAKINLIENSAKLDLFDKSSLMDIVQYIGNDEFRMLFVNPSFGRVVLLNNCINNNGTSLIFQKEMNTKTMTLSCGNYIDIKVSNPSVYGKGKYGKGQYGDGTYIINSARREV